MFWARGTPESHPKSVRESLARAELFDPNVTADSMVFLGCDLVALVVQAAGGALASIAVGKKKNPDNVRNFAFSHNK
jgi:hypothetical protein